MSRLPFPDKNKLSDRTKEVLDKLPDANIFRMLSYSEHLIAPFTRLGNTFLFKGHLDPILRELAILRVGHLSGANYEIAHHERIGRDVGMTEDLLLAVRSGPEAADFTPLERLVMRFTDEVVLRGKPDTALFDSVCDELEPAQVQELTLLIGYYMTVCRFLETFEIELESDGRDGIRISTERS